MIELIAVPALLALGAGGLELAAKFDWMPTMARVRLFGTEFAAEVLADNGDGTFQMKAKQHTARTSSGTIFTAKKAEITEMAAAEMPGAVPAASPSIPAVEAPIPDGQATLDAAMAEERKTLPTPAELIAAHRAGMDQKAPSNGSEAPSSGPKALTTGLNVPPGPTAAPPAPNPQGSTPMSHLADKAKAVAAGSKTLAADAEAAFDAALAKQADVKARLGVALDKMASVTADADAGTSAIEEAVKGLTN